MFLQDFLVGVGGIDGLYSVRLVGYKIDLVGNTEQKEWTKGYPTILHTVHVSEDECV